MSSALSSPRYLCGFLRNVGEFFGSVLSDPSIHWHIIPTISTIWTLRTATLVDFPSHS
ncbi:hypothetical protein CPB84DRAFT_263198 [Gymnopilus junonius]|uniref:Uncharacterized protein n=1 Tax=Gymnopilus junonius TaxID=109634 RepID=A0A9P5NFE6_GYMJU|nr:hypothetical protein CPB84DRAFT_263198 [Gymnopilus junonius]